MNFSNFLEKGEKMVRFILDSWELVDKIKLRLNDRKERNMERKIVSAIKENNTSDPTKIAEITGISNNDVENVLVSLENRGFIKILSGGSQRVVTFAIIKNLDELL